MMKHHSVRPQPSAHEENCSLAAGGGVSSTKQILTA